MRIKTIHQELKLYSDSSELPIEERELLHQAKQFLELSYAPYSGFNVASALLLENNEIISGANQENASYPLCLCAERVALHHAAMRFPGKRIKAMAITARNEKRSPLGPIPPCGACRQVISEYERMLNCKIKILMQGSTSEVMILDSVDQILPLGFNRDFLEGF